MPTLDRKRVTSLAPESCTSPPWCAPSLATGASPLQRAPSARAPSVRRPTHARDLARRRTGRLRFQSGCRGGIACEVPMRRRMRSPWSASARDAPPPAACSRLRCLHAHSSGNYLLQGVAEHEMAKNGRAQGASTLWSPSTHETRFCASFGEVAPTPARLVAAIDPTEAAPPARRSQPAQEPPEQTQDHHLEASYWALEVARLAGGRQAAAGACGRQGGVWAGWRARRGR